MRRSFVILMGLVVVIGGFIMGGCQEKEKALTLNKPQQANDGQTVDVADQAVAVKEGGAEVVTGVAAEKPVESDTDEVAKTAEDKTGAVAMKFDY